jgi:protein PhnA
MQQEVFKRAGEQCEFCQSRDGLEVIVVSPREDQGICLCESCRGQVLQEKELDPNHWHCLSESMWSEHPAVQVMAYRMLSRLKDQSWALDLLEQIYLEDENLAWAKEGLQENLEAQVPTKDSNGTVLNAGDTVTLIKDLDVKGAGFTAKRGTTVKNISLTDNPEHIEGKVNGTQIVLVSKFLKKVNP